MMSSTDNANGLSELLALDDDKFVHSAYLALLGRVPDSHGAGFYRQRLAQGTPKFQILWEIKSSEEGLRFAAGAKHVKEDVAGEKLSLARASREPDDVPTAQPVGRINLPIRPVAGLGSLPQEKIFYFVDHTVLCPANTGMQRTVRMLAKALIFRSHDVVFVKWDAKHSRLALISLAERKHLAEWNGPSLSDVDLARYQNDAHSEGGVATEPNNWLLVPEVTHINYHGFPTTSLLLDFAASQHLRTAFLFYDAIPLNRAELSAVAPTHLDYMKCLARADVILAISEWVKADFLKHAGGGPDAAGEYVLKALPLPAESILAPRATGKDNKSSRIILSVGSITPHKNQITLVRAFDAFCRKNAGADWRLLLIGHVHPDVAGELRELIAVNQRISHLPGATDEEVKAAYNSCDFTVFPSLEEGFGLPIVESLWFGKPCVCGNFGAMLEAGRNGGCVLVDTHSQTDLEHAITLMINDAAYRQSLRDQIIQLRLDTWVDYADCATLILRDCEQPQPVTARPLKGLGKKRVFWLGMHKVLVKTELIRLRELGYEVFNPPYLSDMRDQSAEMDWDAAQESTLPQVVFDKLSSTNFFYASLDDSTAELLNKYFDAVIVTIAPIWLEPIIKKYRGPMIYRVYGQAHSITTELENRGIRPFVENKRDFYFMPHAHEAVRQEESWFRKQEHVVPYCLTNDVFGYMDSWARRVQGGEVALTCPNISNSFFAEHYQYLKKNFPSKFFRMYGVQTTRIDDVAVVGSLPRYQVLDRWTKVACYVYTYQDPRVCYLPPIEMMVIGVPVLFMEGSLLDSYFAGVDTPARFGTPAQALALCDRIRSGDFKLIDEILSHQDPVRRRYMPSHVWPEFDHAILGMI